MIRNPGKPRAGGILFLLLALAIMLPVAASFWPLLRDGDLRSFADTVLEPRFIASVRYGLSQALASSALAMLIGFPGAFFLARRNFRGRRMMAALTVIPFAMPALIIAIGFVLYYGYNGYINQALMRAFQLNQPPVRVLYSFWGLVFTHAFYNFPLVMRYVADAWLNLPESQQQAAALLGASPFRSFRTITLPRLLPAFAAAGALVFLLCFFSFVIVLMFSSPGMSTPEVEIYRAARFEFNQYKASALALTESLLAMLVLILYAGFENRASVGNEAIGRPLPPRPIRGILERAGLFLYQILIVVFFGGPLVSILAESLIVRNRNLSAPRVSWGLDNYGKIFASENFRTAFIYSILIGLGTAFLSMLLGALMALDERRGSSVLARKVLPLLPLAVSSIVLAYGWTNLMGGSSPLVVVLVQTVSCYPFTYKAIQSALGRGDLRYREAAASLGAGPLRVMLTISLPLALPSLLSGLGFAFALSLGDATALIMAPVQGLDTLATLLYKSAGSYRFNEACVLAVILAAITALAFYFRDRHYADA